MTTLDFEFLQLRIRVELIAGKRLLVCGEATFPASRADGAVKVPIDGTLADDRPKRRVAIDRLEARQKAVARYRELQAANPTLSQTVLWERVSTGFGVSAGTVKNWVSRAEAGDSLADRYVKAESFDEKRLKGALFVAGWWSYRIGNLNLINGDVLRQVIDVLGKGYSTADLLATIDRYYAYDTDRAKYPFKTITRFLKYDLDKWVIRAAETNDFLRSKKQVREAASNDLRTRRRAASDPLVRAELHRASEPRAQATGLSEQCNPSEPSSSSASSAQSVEQSSRFLDRIGFTDTARDVVASTDSRSIAARPATTMAEALAKMPDAYRTLLLSCKVADRDALDQAAATLPLWWDHVPDTTRHNIDARVAAWLRDHPRAVSSAARRKVLMLLPYLQPSRSGITRLGVACRIG